jgi:dTDP-glucose 4,6-dehydratase
MTNPLAADLDHVLEHTAELWQEFRGERLFITGGTGFIGCWLLESFLWANARLNLRASAVVLTRRREAFRQKAPHLAQSPHLHVHGGDIRSFAFPEGAFRHVIHGAAESSTTLNADDPLAMLDTIIRGTERTLAFAHESGVEKFLLLSSGAVYGRQPAALSRLPEDYRGAPDPAEVSSAYGEGKRVAEYLCAVQHTRQGLAAKIARCFAFIGPYLPLDAHFAAGNFLGDGLKGDPIHVNGDGTPQRSYLYAADLAIWLWTILVRGTAGRPYNVGSEQAVTIAELARQVAAYFEVPVTTAKPRVLGQPPEKYVPDVTRAGCELGLRAWITLPDAIRRTARWHREALSSYISQ